MILIVTPPHRAAFSGSQGVLRYFVRSFRYLRTWDLSRSRTAECRRADLRSKWDYEVRPSSERGYTERKFFHLISGLLRTV